MELKKLKTTMMIQILAILALSSEILASPFSRRESSCDRKKSQILRGIRRKDKEVRKLFFDDNFKK
jgi:hypothetical protein